MLVTPSALVGRLSGRAGGVVAASWKGRQYVRTHVIPANPQTDAQDVVRESFARCLPLWRSLHVIVKEFLDLYGAGYRMSGFNIFVSKNRLLEQTETGLKPVPDVGKIPAPAAFAAVEGAGAGGDIDCTWTPAGPAALTDIGIMARLTDADEFTAFNAPGDGEGAFTISGLEPAGVYDVYAFYLDSSIPDCGTSVCIADVTAKAA
ncbi:unnamed protein product [marine sediment metagenome]|uniref:Uncharacterized protein n=1 Tax=marine sediment metagenome TaxID=412755 RepID=X1UNF7_9ZZZZ